MRSRSRRRGAALSLASGGEWCIAIRACSRSCQIPIGARSFELAGDGFAFSLICCAHAKPRRNSWAAFYAQRTPLRLVADLPMRARGGLLSGIELVDSTEHERIARELARVLHRPPALPHRTRGSARAAAERKPAPAAGGPLGLDLERLTAGELALALAVVEKRRERPNPDATSAARSTGPAGPATTERSLARSLRGAAARQRGGDESRGRLGAAVSLAAGQAR